MFKKIVTQIEEIAREPQHAQTLRILSDAWNKEKVIESPLKGIDNKSYAFRVLDILQNELKVQSPTILASGYGLYQYFYGKKLEGISPEIAQITEGFLTVNSLPTSNIKNQADNYRGMVLNMASDLRAVLIAMAVNVLELRFIQLLQPTLKNKTTQSVLLLNKYVYVPVAHRLGFYKLKLGLEDIILKQEEPTAFQEIKSKLKESEDERELIINEFIKPINDSLKSQGMTYTIKGRTKSINSIFTKMKNQGVPYEKVYDLWATRIIIDSKKKDEKADCWHVFSVVANLYQPQLARMRDWISVPRENGYESLHITVKTEDERYVEVQIRTERMDDEAENGMAAHWRYKGGKDNFGIDFWLDNIKHALEDSGDLLGKEEFRSNKFSTELFAFTPNGDLKKLKIGATILDFAFAIHSEVGLSCVGGKVNGKNVGIKHHLRNGDQVEIFTQKNQKPSLDWLNIVTSNRAKLHIRKAFDKEGKIEATFGKDILLRKLKNWKLTFKQDVLDELLKAFEYKAVTDLYKSFYHEKIDLSRVKAVLLKDNTQEQEDSNDTEEYEQVNDDFDQNNESSNDDLLVVDNLANINYSLAKCCNPIIGDKIFGFVTVSKGISIHRSNCPNAKDLRNRYEYRIIPAVWQEKTIKHNFRAELHIKGADKDGIIAELSNVLHTKLGVPILNINMNSDGSEFLGKIVVKVHDKEQLSIIIEKLKELSIIDEVYRKS